MIYYFYVDHSLTTLIIILCNDVPFLDARQRRFVHNAVLATAYQPWMTVHARDEPVRVSWEGVPRVWFKFGRHRVWVCLFWAAESDYVCVEEKKAKRKSTHRSSETVLFRGISQYLALTTGDGFTTVVTQFRGRGGVDDRGFPSISSEKN